MIALMKQQQIIEQMYLKGKKGTLMLRSEFRLMVSDLNFDKATIDQVFHKIRQGA